MTNLTAALTVLKAIGHPMTAREITEEAIRRGLLQPQGKTPHATMSAALYTDLHANRETPFMRLYESGKERAVRGSVHWTLKDDSQHVAGRESAM